MASRRIRRKRRKGLQAPAQVRVNAPAKPTSGGLAPRKAGLTAVKPIAQLRFGPLLKNMTLFKRLEKLRRPDVPRRVASSVLAARRVYEAAVVARRTDAFKAAFRKRKEWLRGQGRIADMIREFGRSNCKERPADNHSKGGGSRAFVPWCNDERHKKVR